MNKKTQFEWLLEAVEIKKKNPELDIYIVTDTSDGVSDVQEIKNVEISPWFEYAKSWEDVRVLTDKSDIIEYFEEKAPNSLSESQLKAYCEERYVNKVSQAICIYTSE